MQVLSPQTQLPAQKVERRHRPRKSRYQQLADCLSWEFGFHCAFCWIHDSDLNEHGFSGMGFMWVEHLAPRSTNPDQADSYVNCVYSCRFCNRARGDQPLRNIVAGELYNPCQVPWAELFRLSDDRLDPIDVRAERTSRVYDLNDPRKVTLRRNRREALTEAFRVLEELPAVIAALLRQAEQSSPSARRQLVRTCRELRTVLLRALQQARRFRAVPANAASSCRCDPPVLELPEFIREQLTEVG